MDASNYVLSAAYTLAVDPLDWGKLKALRGAKKNTAMAEAALGERASQHAVKTTANYFSRIIQGRVPSVGIDKLRLLAIGLGYDTMTAFFADLENVSRDSTQTSLILPPEPSHNPPLAKEAMSGPPVPGVGGLDKEVLRYFGRIVGRAIRDSARYQQTASTRARRSKSGRVRSGRH